MKRRSLLKLFSMGGLAAGMMSSGRLLAAPSDYRGRFLVTIQADGAWDVSSFCDPKTNVAGEPDINNWAHLRDPDSAGNINYAAFADNRYFFEKYHRYMMVINGIDYQTNAHAVGILHNWSGRNSQGFPSLPALYCAVEAPNLPMSYLSFGGWGQTDNLVHTTVVSDVSPLANILKPNVGQWDPDNNVRLPEANAIILKAQQARLKRLAGEEGILPRQQYNIASQRAALAGAESLEAFADILPGPNQWEQPVTIGDHYTSTRQQAQVAVLGFRSGAAASADLHMGGFDTHSSHDADHEPLMAALTDAVDYLWDYAEENGVADRMTVILGSDFARTPFYNSYEGKDHWSIGSLIVMEKNATWGNRVIGLTDEAQNAYRINPSTLKRDDKNGTIIYPKHVHKALRRYLGVSNFADQAGYQFANTEDFDFFNPRKSTS